MRKLFIDINSGTGRDSNTAVKGRKDWKNRVQLHSTHGHHRVLTSGYSYSNTQKYSSPTIYLCWKTKEDKMFKQWCFFLGKWSVSAVQKKVWDLLTKSWLWRENVIRQIGRITIVDGYTGMSVLFRGPTLGCRLIRCRYYIHTVAISGKDVSMWSERNLRTLIFTSM